MFYEITLNDENLSNKKYGEDKTISIKAFFSDKCVLENTKAILNKFGFIEDASRNQSNTGYYRGNLCIQIWTTPNPVMILDTIITDDRNDKYFYRKSSNISYGNNLSKEYNIEFAEIVYKVAHDGAV